MRLVIEIDEDVFTRLFDNGTEDYAIVNDDLFAVAKSIRNGMPLPEHHGRIIDESKITKLYTYVPNSFCKGGGWKTEDFNATNTDAPTIIEAEGSESKR